MLADRWPLHLLTDWLRGDAKRSVVRRQIEALTGCDLVERLIGPIGRIGPIGFKLRPPLDFIPGVDPRSRSTGDIEQFLETVLL